ncbi:hypothetical protein HYS10_01785 [Candidatus Collierbacteria bacterium]|nr:hypothetical protein [Candidatus Collierbacteria bacterium]
MIEAPRLSLENYHCPNCAAPLDSSYCRHCGSTITSFLLAEKIKWPKERDLAIDLSLVAAFDRIAAQAGLATLTTINDESLIIQVRQNYSQNWKQALIINTYDQGRSPIFAGEAPLVYTLHYQNDQPGWQGRLRISSGQKNGRQSRVYFVRFNSGRTLDHQPETLVGELELVNSRRLATVINSISSRFC